MRARVEREEGGPERTCAVTGVKGPPEAMIRFALSAEGAVVADIRQKLPGRGVWICGRRATVGQAVAKRAFSRGFRADVRADADLAGDVDRLLEQDALRFFSLVNKAGLVTVGAAKVEAAIRAAGSKGNLAGLIQASDGAPDGITKLEKLLAGVLGERAGNVARINLFESRQLDLALGRTNVIHAALDAGPASAVFLAKIARLILYRSDGTEPAAVSGVFGAKGVADEID